jgi:predicted DNA-binding WGR domain protein
MQEEPRSIRLVFVQGTSNKEYNVYLERRDEDWGVSFTYGRIGGRLMNGTKTPEAVPHAQASKVYDDLVASKIKIGYREEGKPESK